MKVTSCLPEATDSTSKTKESLFVKNKLMYVHNMALSHLHNMATDHIAEGTNYVMENFKRVHDLIKPPGWSPASSPNLVTPRRSKPAGLTEL